MAIRRCGLALLTMTVACGTDWWAAPESPVLPGCVQVNRTAIDFGALPLGTPTTDVVRVSNDCGDAQAHGTLTIGEVSLLNDDMALNVGHQGWRSVAYGESAFIQISFRPEERGELVDELQIEMTWPDLPLIRIPLTGMGLAPALVWEADQTDFGSPPVGCPVRLPARLRNEGNTELVVHELEVARDWEFDVDRLLERNGPLPWTVPVGDEVEFDVTFDPQSTGPKEGIVWANSTDLTSHIEGLTFVASAVIEEQQTDLFVVEPPSDPDEMAQFVLSQPAMRQTITLRINGHLVTRWSFHTDSNTVLIDAEIAQPGNRIEVRYSVQPDCESEEG